MTKRNKNHLSCGLLRRDTSGRWFYGERQIGVDNELFAGELERAMLEVSGAPEAELATWTSQPMQLSLDWPTETPVVDVDAKMTLKQAHKQVWASLDEGAFCPCCQREARRYARRLHAEMATFLVQLAKQEPKRYHHLRDILPGGEAAPKISTDGAYLTLWGLVKRHPQRAGLYMITKAGMAFVRGQTTVPQVAWVYSGRATHFSKNKISIRDALDESLDVDAMLRDVQGPGMTR